MVDRNSNSAEGSVLEMDKNSYYFDMAQFGSILSGRDEGLLAYNQLNNLLSKLPKSTILSIDVSRVQILNPSFADETIGTLLINYPGRVEVAGEPSLPVKKSLETVEESRGVHIPFTR